MSVLTGFSKLWIGLGVCCLLGAGNAASSSEAEVQSAPLPHGEQTRDHQHESRDAFRRELTLTVRPDHPAILPVADAIRAVTKNPLEQLMMVNDVTHLLVDYDDDERVYGSVEYLATLDEMIARRREAGWIYLRDDCDGRAVFAAHLLAALGIEWKLQASYWKRHAWITATVKGVTYDLLDLRKNAPETRDLSYRLVGHFFVRSSRPPPFFNWRIAWLERTHGDLEIGLRLGMLEVDSTREEMHERFSTDWTKRVPDGKLSPVDPRALTARYAGFPLGESLQVRALAAKIPSEPKPANIGREIGAAP